MARTKKKSKGSELAAQTDPRAPLDSAGFLKAAQPVLELLTKDLLARADASEGITAALKVRHAVEVKEKLTADAYDQWRRQVVVQIAAGWLLSCVFVRTLEDRGLLPHNRIAGPGAMDAQHTFFSIAPYLTERDYLRAVFTELEHVPACKELFDREHNLTWRLAPSAEATKELLGLFRMPDAAAPGWRFGQSSTRFLGDLYQDLSEDVRKRFALLQTPDFIESFILDRTLEPAVEEFGLADTTVIDPTCGSGHFLLGAFERLFEKWSAAEPGASVESAVGKALGSVYGVDVNPYAVSIARFRLTLAAVEKLGVGRIAAVPRLPLRVVVADSLLHNGHAQQADLSDIAGQKHSEWWSQPFRMSDESAARGVLSRTFRAVVGNPPFGSPLNRSLKEWYRKCYDSAGGKFVLSAPFTELFFQLGGGGGYIGMINSSTFSTKSFGRSLIERVLPRYTVTSIVDLAGVYFRPPGFGVPTLLLFGRSEKSDRSTMIMRSLSYDPGVYEDPGLGKVWQSVRRGVDQFDYSDEYVEQSVIAKGDLHTWPWRLVGGDGARVAALLENACTLSLADCSLLCKGNGAGTYGMTNADSVFLVESTSPVARANAAWFRPHMTGETVRDYMMFREESVFFPYDSEGRLRELSAETNRWLWPYRRILEDRATFDGGTYRDTPGKTWYQWHQLTRDRALAAHRIVFPELQTESHFVLDDVGCSASQSVVCFVPSPNLDPSQVFGLLAYLNSSMVACWIKARCARVGTARGDISRERGAQESDRYRLNGTMADRIPVSKDVLVDLALQKAGRLLHELGASRVALRDRAFHDVLLNPSAHQEIRSAYEARETELVDQAVVIQEEVDWRVYHIVLGQRCTVATDVDSDGSASHPSLRPFCRADSSDERLSEAKASSWRQRLHTIDEDPDIGVLEAALFKRSWLGQRGVFGRAKQDVESRFSAIRDRALVLRAEDILAAESEPKSIRWMCAKMGLGDEDESLLRLLVSASALPFSSAMIYSSLGLAKRKLWSEVWDLQRRQDVGEKVDFAAPPRFEEADYVGQGWRLRNDVDAPRERFIDYSSCASDLDQEDLFGWSGWDCARRAQVAAMLYQARKSEEAWSSDRLRPLLAAVDDLCPWLKQWFNVVDPVSGYAIGDFFEQWLDEECRGYGWTRGGLT